MTLRAVATSREIAVRGGTVHAEGDLDLRGTLGVDEAAPVGFRAIRLRIDLDLADLRGQLIAGREPVGAHGGPVSGGGATSPHRM